MEDRPADDAVLLQLPELLDQHLLRHRGNRALELGKAQHATAEEMEENHQLPSAFEQLERFLDALGRGLAGVIVSHTLR